MNMIYITEHDKQRLLRLLDERKGRSGDARDNLERLREELQRATPVKPEEVPHDVITMQSTVRIRDMETGEENVYTLVFPSDENYEDRRISILAPIGTAMLGYRIGDIFEWKAPAGVMRMRVEEILYQPEAAHKRQ